jgi:DNA primase
MSTRTEDNLKGVMDRIREFLPQYLESNGVKISSKGMFKCCSPDHDDSTPSAGLVPGSNSREFHCFGCNISADIFLAANFLEGKPVSGPGFITDNVIYLAKKYGIDVPSMAELNEDELHEMELYRAYNNASAIVKSSVFSERVKNKITDLGWPENPMKQIGVGSVTSYNDYITRMTGTYKHKIEFLREADLDRKAMFNENNLIYTVKDENGNPVGFACRNLKYEEQKAEYDKGINEQLSLEFSSDVSTDSSSTKSEGSCGIHLFKPVKYINTDVKCYIYKKSKRLFNFNLARKAAPPLYVFEGYSDSVTAYIAGLKNACSIGSTSFSKDHLELILETGIKHIIFVLDADKAGEIGTERFVKLLEENVGGRIGLRTEIVVMPEGSDDPDSFIRKHGSNGLQAFLKLEKIDIFSWSLRKGIASGKDPIALASESIPLIVNEPNFMLRMDMAEKLVAETGLPKSGIWGEIMRQVDADASQLKEEKVSIAKLTSKELLTSGKDIELILESAIHKVETLQNSRVGFDVSNVAKCISLIVDRAEKTKERIEIKLGFDYLDLNLEVPAADCFICVPGKPNQGKAQPLSAKIKTPTGWATMGDVKIGDELASVDGQQSIITGIFPQGVEKTYKITFSDGRFTTASGSHLWDAQLVHKHNIESHSGWQTLTTDALRLFCLNGNRHNDHNKMYIPLINGDFGNSTSLLVHPWLMGALLGDGGLTSRTPVITTNDQHIVDKVTELTKSLNVIPKKTGRMGYRLSAVHADNLLTKYLVSYGLMKHGSATKFIPKEYLEAPKEDRIHLLQGLMDTDGCAGKTGECSYSTISKQLGLDVQYLVRSLGGLCKIVERHTTYKYKGDLKNGQLSYHLLIRMPERETLFSLPRKVDRCPTRINQPRLTIQNVEYIGEQETQCIVVSHPSKLYITDDFVVTHNSSILDNLIWRILENNDDAIVFLHTVDDALSARIPRILGSKYNLPSKYFKKAGYYLDNPPVDCPNFQEKYQEATKWLSSMIENERLVLADVSMLPQSLVALESWAKTIRTRNPNKKIVVMGDNFHLYHLPGNDTGEEKIRKMSAHIKTMCNVHKLVGIFTFELPKEALRPGVRPRVSKIKGSSGPAYDANVNFGIYNDLKDMGEDRSDVFWLDSTDMRIITDPSGIEVNTPTKKPIIELVVDKSKISSFDGVVFFKLDPISGRMDECSLAEQAFFSDKTNQGQSKKQEYSYSNDH